MGQKLRGVVIPLAIYLSVFKVFFIAIMSQLFEVTLPMNLH